MLCRLGVEHVSYVQECCLGTDVTLKLRVSEIMYCEKVIAYVIVALIKALLRVLCFKFTKLLQKRS